jgi:hypothetical protein
VTADRDKSSTTLIDADVSSAYRELSTERAPARLGGDILRSAAAAARKHPTTSWLWLFTRPLAVAAMLAVGLLVYQQLSVPGNDGTGVYEQQPLAGTGAPAVGANDGRYPCNREQTTSAAAWSACIEALDTAGLHEQAATERARLQKAYPLAKK